MALDFSFSPLLRQLGFLLLRFLVAFQSIQVSADGIVGVVHKGSIVRAFFSSTTTGKNRKQYVALRLRQEGTWTPRMGLTEGWLPAEVLKEVDLAQCTSRKPCVKVRYVHHLWVSQTGHEPPRQTLEDYVPAEDVEQVDFMPKSWQLLPSFPEPAPDLGILLFRWGGGNEVPNPDEWGVFGNTAHPSYVRGLIEHGLKKLLPHRYEIWTIFVHRGTDLEHLTASATAFAHHPIRRCKQQAALFMLFPTMYRERSEVHKLRGNDGAALISQSSLYRAMERLEADGIPVKFPHPANLYHILAGKTWLYHMSSVDGWAVPPTVSVPRGLVEENSSLAAQNAITMLTRVKALRGLPGAVTRGVTKLGFSWEALDVAPWNGVADLAKSLTDFIHSYEIEGQITTLSHDTPLLIVQDFMKHVLEMRLYVIDGKVEKILYTKMVDTGEGTFGKFEKTAEVDGRVLKWIKGDREALADAETKAKALIERWLIWLQVQTCAPIAAVRFDWYVSIVAPGQAEVFLGEITENGFSMLGDDGTLGQKVFHAIVRDALGQLNLTMPESEGAGSTSLAGKFEREGAGSASEEL